MSSGGKGTHNYIDIHKFIDKNIEILVEYMTKLSLCTHDILSSNLFHTFKILFPIMQPLNNFSRFAPEPKLRAVTKSKPLKSNTY